MAMHDSTVKPGKTKTAQALAYLKENPGSSVYAAAKMFNLPTSGIYRRLKQLQESPTCPCCGQILKGDK